MVTPSHVCNEQSGTGRKRPVPHPMAAQLGGERWFPSPPEAGWWEWHSTSRLSRAGLPLKKGGGRAAKDVFWMSALKSTAATVHFIIGQPSNETKQESSKQI